MNFNKMDPLMKALRAANQRKVGQTELTTEDLKRERHSLELAGKVATPPIGVSSEEFSIGDIKAEWIRPDFAHETRHVILDSHGGGYTSGALGYARILGAKLALHAGVEVLSYEYRLAPEHPYPAAFEDAMQVWDYLMLQGYGANQVILAGDSAGGNLTLEILLALKEQERKLPRAAVLFSPWTDMTATSESYQTRRENDPILTYDYIITVRNAFAPADSDFSDAKYSPLFGDLSGFPPILIQVGENEILYDDSKKLYEKLIKENSPVTFQSFPDGWHVFQQMPLPMSAQAIKDAAAFIQKELY